MVLLLVACNNFKDKKQPGLSKEIIDTLTNDIEDMAEGDVDLSDFSVSDTTDAWAKFPFREMPLIDSTNFDNIKKVNQLNTSDIEKLQLKELYSDMDSENSNYVFYPSYKLDFGDFKSIVVNVFKGEHELESVLIIYDSDGKLIKLSNSEDGKPLVNSVVLAYDEIAEGWSRKTSKIANYYITAVHVLYTEPPQIDTLQYHVNRFGEINQVNYK